MIGRIDETPPQARMTLRRDHLAGGVFVVAALGLWAASGDLPFGTLASPGAGMMPMLVLAVIVVFGAVVALRGGDSPPLAELDWSDARHAITLVVVSGVAIALYTRLGFVLTMAAMMFVLLFVVEKRLWWRAALVAVGLSVACYLVFGTLLKSPLPAMPAWS